MGGRETVTLLQSIPNTKQQLHAMIMRKRCTLPLLIINAIIQIVSVEGS